MAEKYLEQAVVTLASAFSENGDAVTSAIPDLSGTLTGLGMHMATLNSSLKLIVDRQRIQEEQSNAMRHRIVELENLCTEAHLRLELLTNSRDGIVSWSTLNPILDDMARRAEVKSIDDRCASLDQRVALMVTKADIQPFRATVTQQLDALEKHSAASDDKLSTFIKGTSKRLDGLKAVADELIQSHAAQQVSHDNTHGAMREDYNAATASLRAELKIVETTAADSLGHSVEEIVKCLTKHSQAIEDINNRESRWHEKTANVKEVHALRKEMVAMKREMEASSYKVHEAYSKCLSIATLAGKGGNSGNGSGTMLGGGSGAAIDAVSFGGGASNADGAGAGAGGGGGYTVRSNVGGGDRHHHAMLGNGNGNGTVQTLETQIEVLRQDLADVRSSQLPTLHAHMLNLRMVADTMRRESNTTDVVMRNLLFVLSEGNSATLGKLVEALMPLKEPMGGGGSARVPLGEASVNIHHTVDAAGGTDHLASSHRHGTNNNSVTTSPSLSHQNSFSYHPQQQQRPSMPTTPSRRGGSRGGSPPRGSKSPAFGLNTTAATTTNNNIVPPSLHASPSSPSAPSDLQLAVAIVDQYIRSTMNPILNTMATTLTQKQAFLQEEAVSAETARRLTALANAKVASPHGVAPEEVSTTDGTIVVQQPSADELMAKFRLGIEVADAFSAEERFSAMNNKRRMNANGGKPDDATAAQRGVDVMGVEHGSVGHAFGLVVGDRIVAVGGTAIDSAAGFVSQLRRVLTEGVSAGTFPVVVTLMVEAKDGRTSREIMIEVGAE